MNYIAENLRFLRKQKGYTQADLAHKLGVNRSLIGAYEEGRSEPRLKTIQTLCVLFKVNYQQILAEDLSRKSKDSSIEGNDKYLTGEKIRILPIATSESGGERVSLVPQRAAAGYTQGYADVSFIEQLHTAVLPFPELGSDRTYRIFQIEGDSMLPVVPGSYLLSEYVENWRHIKDQQTYVVLTANDGIVFKRVRNEIAEKQRLWMQSDNPLYQPYPLPISEVLEVWQVRGLISFELPDINTMTDYKTQELLQMMQELRAEVRELSKTVHGGQG